MVPVQLIGREEEHLQNAHSLTLYPLQCTPSNGFTRYGFSLSGRNRIVAGQLNLLSGWNWNLLDSR